MWSLRCLLYTHQAPVEIRDRCCVGKWNIKAEVLFCPHWGCFSQGSAVFQLGMPHFRLAVDRPCTSLTSSVCHGFQQQELLLLMLRVEDLCNFYCDTETKKNPKSDEIDSRSVWDLREFFKGIAASLLWSRSRMGSPCFGCFAGVCPGCSPS